MGYDLRHLLIGAEGTLGVITAATLRLFPKPTTTGAALMVVPDASAALGLLRLAQRGVGAGLSAFEIMHRMGLDFLREVGPEVRHPFAEPPEWMCLIDLGMGVRATARRRAGGALCRGVRGGSSPMASWPSPRRSGPNSGPCARPSRSPIGGSGRSRRTTSRSRWPRSRLHRGGAGPAGGDRRLPDQLLRPSWRRQPALQRLPPDRPDPRGPRGRAARDQAVRP
jgi:FAD/FMN-containing dehydrogenase